MYTDLKLRTQVFTNGSQRVDHQSDVGKHQTPRNTRNVVSRLNLFMGAFSQGASGRIRTDLVHLEEVEWFPILLLMKVCQYKKL